MELTRIEKNRIYEAIGQTGLDPTELQLAVNHNKVVITHSSGSKFAFEFSLTLTNLGTPKYEVMAIVAQGSKRVFDTGAGVDYIVQPVREWAEEVKLVCEMPDFWTRMPGSRNLFVEIHQENADNTPFTEGEQQQILSLVQAAKKEIGEKFDLTNKQMEQLSHGLDEAVEASKRIGRKDWRLLFVGVIFTVIIAATVPPEVAEHILVTVIHGLVHLFTGENGPPHVPPPALA